MINVSCYNCGSDEHVLYATENGFTLVKCSHCGLLYVTPRPDDREIEEATRLGVHPGDHLLDMTGGFMRYKYTRYLEVLKDIYGSELTNRKCTWLDVGCGHGEFIMALQKFSNGHVITEGLEPMEAKRKAASNRGLNVSYFDLQAPKQQYDFVSFLNVYSHLPNPPEFFLMLRKCLRTRGELLVETGDSASLSAEDHFKPFYLPSHLSFASEGIVAGILDKCGFEFISVKKYPAFFPRFILMTALKELVKAALPNKKSQIGKIYSMYRISKKAPTDMYIRAAMRS
jgi:SAM-dependent methyltransferase